MWGFLIMFFNNLYHNKNIVFIYLKSRLNYLYYQPNRCTFLNYIYYINNFWIQARPNNWILDCDRLSPRKVVFNLFLIEIKNVFFSSLVGLHICVYSMTFIISFWKKIENWCHQNNNKNLHYLSLDKLRTDLRPRFVLIYHKRFWNINKTTTNSCTNLV